MIVKDEIKGRRGERKRECKLEKRDRKERKR